MNLQILNMKVFILHIEVTKERLANKDLDITKQFLTNIFNAILEICYRYKPNSIEWEIK